MGEQAKKAHISAGLLAHVDAGKTTLSEALLYLSGKIRTLGRVDHGNTFLDTNEIEKEKGIQVDFDSIDKIIENVITVALRRFK